MNNEKFLSTLKAIEKQMSIIPSRFVQSQIITDTCFLNFNNKPLTKKDIKDLGLPMKDFEYVAVFNGEQYMEKLTPQAKKSVKMVGNFLFIPSVKNSASLFILK